MAHCPLAGAKPNLPLSPLITSLNRWRQNPLPQLPSGTQPASSGSRSYADLASLKPSSPTTANNSTMPSSGNSVQNFKSSHVSLPQVIPKPMAKLRLPTVLFSRSSKLSWTLLRDSGLRNYRMYSRPTALPLEPSLRRPLFA